MPTKIINAKKILEKKGIVQKQFDTAAFSAVVEDFFMTHDVSATIVLYPQRFVEMKNPPEGDFIDCLDDKMWERRAKDPKDPFNWSNIVRLQEQDILRPMLVIDEPFIGNAAAYLRNFCGFTVTSRVRQRTRQFIVSLPI